MRRLAARCIPASLVPICMLAAMVFVGCETQHETNWGRLQQGMSKQEVEELLGAPSSRVDARRTGTDVAVAFDRWQYGDNLSTLATGVVFPGEAPDRVWAVYFDDDGEVIDFRQPLRPW